MGHLNSFSASGGENLNTNFPKIQMPGGLPGGGGMLKLRFDWYIRKRKRMLESQGFPGQPVFLSRRKPARPLH